MFSEERGNIMKRRMEEIISEMWELSYESGDPEGSHIEADDLLLEALQVASEEGIEKHEADALKVAYESIGKWYS